MWINLGSGGEDNDEGVETYADAFNGVSDEEIRYAANFFFDFTSVGEVASFPNAVANSMMKQRHMSMCFTAVRNQLRVKEAVKASIAHSVKTQSEFMVALKKREEESAS